MHRPLRSLNTRRVRVCAAAGLLLLVGVVRFHTASSAGPDWSLAGPTMGTSYSVKFGDLPPDVDRRHVAAGVQSRLDRVNALMSTYRPDSEISRFNASGNPGWFAVSTETAAVMAEALGVGRMTGGALDVTVGPLVDLWSFGPGGVPAGRLPSTGEIEAVRHRVGLEQIELRDDELPALRKRHPKCRVDLSAVAKGFAVDQVAEFIEASGIENYLVEIGGEVRTRGRGPSGRPWQIGVQRPSADRFGVHEVISLQTAAMATSGDYHNYFERDGIRYCHIIDPRTGIPVRHRLASVTVLAETCAEADALATALFVLGPEEGFQFACRNGVAALFVVKSPQAGQFFTRQTAAFPAPQPQGKR